MQCPACTKLLKETTVDEVKLDVCDGGCGGIWFDNYELRKFDEPHEEAGVSLLDISRDANIHVDHTAQRSCPKCGDVTMLQHFFSVKREVELDECPRCGGVWLDYGELGRIRNLYDSEAARQKAAADYFDDVFGDQLGKMRLESEAKLTKARRFANMFRFICPSYYIPGKQDGGAF
ncbi:TFIIB-type zinc ribbon-containing protein [Kaarinaea lacus]